jgi:uncharacterized protein (DUF2141 family)
MDMNFLGIPQEQYGFSNDAAALFGPPDFKDARFSHNHKETIVTINYK